MNLLNQYITSLTITAAAMFLMAVFVLFRNPKREINWSFGLYYLSISWWAIGEAYSINAPTKLLGLWLWRINHMGVIFIPVFFVHFIYAILEIPKQKRKLLKIIYGVNFSLALLNLTNLLIADVVPKFSFKHMVIPGYFYLPFVIWWFVTITYGMFKLHIGHLKANVLKRNQLKWLWLGSLIGYLGGPFNFLPAFNIELFPIMPFGTYTVPLYSFIITYAVVKYRLMDIKVAITRTGVFIAVYTLVLGLPFAASIWFKDWFMSIFGENWYFFSVGLVALFAILATFLYLSFERRIEERLLKKQENYQRTLKKQPAIRMMRMRDFQQAIGLIVNIVNKSIGIKYAAVYFYDPETHEFILRKEDNKTNTSISKLPLDNPLISWVMLNRQTLIYEEVKRQIEESGSTAYKSLEEIMRLLNAVVIIPCFLEDRFMGFIVLGEKLSGQIYTLDDLNMFQLVANQATVTIKCPVF